MDPNWDTCSYCEAEEKASQRSVGAQGGSDAGDRQRTMVGSARPATPEPQRVTRAMGEPARPGGYVAAGETRRITGVLITYSWRPEGEIFPVREGKNFIGSGDVSSESAHRACDIQIPHDNMMSGEHSLILCRGGNYEILDQISSNGTFLGGQMLKANQGTDLPNYAEIKTGATSWTFIRVQASGTETKEPGRSPAQPTPPPPRSGDTTVR
jgi:hypothetical protein